MEKHLIDLFGDGGLEYSEPQEVESSISKPILYTDAEPRSTLPLPDREHLTADPVGDGRAGATAVYPTL